MSIKKCQRRAGINSSILPELGESAIPPALAHFSGAPLTQTLELIENCACWPPPTRRAVIGLWCTEAGMHPTEVWGIAARLLEVAA
jgi:hypothetical protein